MNTKDELAKAYDPKPVEEKWGQFWLDEGLFTADAKSEKPKFSMVLPPPNVTGILHMGHALCFTLPDIITRWKRMQGYNCLWLPGTDHASIAVHNVIEKSLAEKGLTREKIGREEFLRIAWEWKAKYGGVITSQLKRLGTSLDWSRERFTMDPGFSRAVKQVFVSLYDEGLIYRDYFLVNRCPHCRTVLSDIEIEHKDLKGKLWHIRYAVEGSDESVVVATTRPETMLGDTALAVHPDDERYAHLHGRRVVLPIQNKLLPVITDERVERDFGTGAVKVTPAHDPVDFELGKKHGLEQVIVIDGEGRMTEAAGPEFAGLDRFAARAKVVEKLRELGALVKIEDHDHAVGHCYRCKSVIEPHLSWQWFVRIKPLADEAIRVVEDGSHQVHPGELVQDLLRVDVQHPRLVHLAPALVGPSHPGLVLPGLRPDRWWPWKLRRSATSAAAPLDQDDGRPRHLVLLGPLALRHPRLAGRDRRPAHVLPDRPDVDRVRHHLLLGGPHDHAGPQVPGRDPLPARLHQRPRARRSSGGR